MTNTPEPPEPPERSAFPSRASEAVVPWWWQHLDPDGQVLPAADGRQEFPTRSDAESWMGEYWSELVEQGVASVTLFEGDREVYGPMSLAP